MVKTCPRLRDTQPPPLTACGDTGMGRPGGGKCTCVRVCMHVCVCTCVYMMCARARAQVCCGAVHEVYVCAHVSRVPARRRVFSLLAIQAASGA